MCAVCWSGTQIIPATAVAARYVWINHFQMRRLAKRTKAVAEIEDELILDDEIFDDAELDELKLEPFECDDLDHCDCDHEHSVEEPLGV